MQARYTIQELSEELNVSENSIRVFCKEHHIPDDSVDWSERIYIKEHFAGNI